MSRLVLRLLNGIYGWVLSLAVVTASIFAGYSLWDNAQIYQAAADVQSQIRQYKPVEDAKGGPSFQELQKVNGDVIGWITVDGTNIDYPILQGQDNLEYMNKDVYGEFSLAGSIFLDTRNKKDFSDNYSLIYGHNMDDHLMFGDLALFKDKEFFQQNTTATLMVPGETRKQEVAAILQIPAGTEEIFNPDRWEDDLDGLAEFLEQNSIWYHQGWIDEMKKDPDSVQITVLVTCSDGSTNDRTVLVLIRRVPKKPDDPTKPQKPHKPGSSGSGGHISGSGPKPTGDLSNPKLWTAMIAGSILFIVAFESMERFLKRRRE